MRVLMAVMCSALLPSAALAKTQAGDQQFLDQAFSINQGEISLGKLAQERGTTAPIRDFGKRLESDHQAALDQLREVAEKSHLTLPVKMQRDEMDLHQQLSKLTGKEFDQAFVEHMVSGHRHAIDLFQEEASHGQDAALRSYAEKQLPILRVHENIAKRDLQRM